MTVSYNRLFKMLIDRKMMKEIVSMEVIARICLTLNCTVDDILEIMPDNPDNGTDKKVR